MRTIKALIVVALTGLAGCADAPPSLVWRWDSINGATFQQAAPPQLLKLSQEAPQQEFHFLREEHGLERWQNRFGIYEIEDSFLQLEKSKAGEILSATGVVAPKSGPDWSPKFEKLEIIKERLYRIWKSGFGSQFSASEIHRDLVVAHLSNSWAPTLRITAVNESLYLIKSFYYNENGLLIHVKEMNLAGVDGTATVFSSAPNNSTLAEKVLKDLIGDGTLTGMLVKAFSAFPPAISEATNQFNYNPDRPEFDSVQAYFFADSQSKWFLENLGLRLNRRLEIKLHVGAPQKSNAMFYYGNQVRLGEGDDVLYRGIPRDPSIVKHEVSHAFVEALSGMAFDGEPGVYSEAFADLFCALAEGKPELGAYAYVPGPYKRTLAAKQFLQFDSTKGKYENSMVVSTLFWSVSEEIGALRTAKLAAEFLVRMGPGAQLKLFIPVLLSSSQAALNESDQLKVRQVLESRGWVL